MDYRLWHIDPSDGNMTLCIPGNASTPANATWKIGVEHCQTDFTRSVQPEDSKLLGFEQLSEIGQISGNVEIEAVTPGTATAPDCTSARGRCGGLHKT